jgi:hypothetical protein
MFCVSDSVIAQVETPSTAASAPSSANGEIPAESTSDPIDVLGPAIAFGTDAIDATSASDSIAFPSPAPVQFQTPGTLRFQFQESDWKDVIPWFAEQAGFSLQPITDWPTGTFYLKDDSEYTVMQALDQLNHALRMRNPASAYAMVGAILGSSILLPAFLSWTIQSRWLAMPFRLLAAPFIPGDAIVELIVATIGMGVLGIGLYAVAVARLRTWGEGA